MQTVEPKVWLVARPSIEWGAVVHYLESIGAHDKVSSYLTEPNPDSPGQELVEIGGRICYKSWEPGLNLNVTRIRKDQAVYLENILKSGHGSVLEHANYSFILQNVSRVFTHELVRHRAGTATSQESLRFVRADDIKMWIPPELQGVLPQALVAETEDFLRQASEHYSLNDPKLPFEEKKKLTSAIRRILPQGMATDLLWTANIRALRHTIEMRTAAGAEVEIRLVFDQIGKIMQEECPLLFGDYEVNDEGEWVTKYRKV